MTVEIRALREDDDRSAFRSGDGALDLFFLRYAGQNQFRHHVGVTYVAADDESIVGFVTVTPAVLDAEDLPSGRKPPPYPLPALRVARLAVDVSARGRGVGKALMRFALDLAVRMRDELGCVGVLVDAKEEAIAFYRRLGFVELKVLEGASRSVPRPTTMYLPLGSVPRRDER
jgi:predicted N-acetyltransferase YhbS